MELVKDQKPLTLEDVEKILKHHQIADERLHKNQEELLEGINDEIENRRYHQEAIRKENYRLASRLHKIRYWLVYFLLCVCFLSAITFYALVTKKEEV